MCQKILKANLEILIAQIKVELDFRISPIPIRITEVITRITRILHLGHNGLITMYVHPKGILIWIIPGLMTEVVLHNPLVFRRTGMMAQVLSQGIKGLTEISTSLVNVMTLLRHLVLTVLRQVHLLIEQNIKTLSKSLS